MGLKEHQVAEKREKQRNARDRYYVVLGAKSFSSCSKDPMHWNTEPTQNCSSSDKEQDNATEEEDSPSKDNNDSENEV